MPLKANDYHNHLKLKIKAQICYFLPFEALFFTKTPYFDLTIPIRYCHFSFVISNKMISFAVVK